MVSKAAVAAAIKAIPGTRGSIAPQASGYGRISPVQSEAYFNNPYRGTYGPFLPRQPEVFSDGAFGPMPPIQPVPVDQPPLGGQFPDPRWWQYTQGWNLPTPPGTEGLKLASFDQLKVLSEKYCLSPETRVLCSDFTWRSLAAISVGDELIAFDENPPAPGQHRKMRTTIVTDCDRIIRPSYRVRFTDGREVTASAEHLWLSGRGKAGGECACHLCGRVFRGAQGCSVHLLKVHGVAGSWKQLDHGAWIATERLRQGSTVRDLGCPWEDDLSRDAGYLAGVFDGEGSFTGLSRDGASSSWGIDFPQLPGAVFDETERILKEKGFYTRSYKNNGDGCRHLVVSGLGESFRFLGQVRPLRLLENSARWLDGGSPSRVASAIVESVEFLGDREVVAIGTSTKTLIAEGFFSHNSVARACITLRIDEVLGLGWEIGLTKEAAKAYQGDHHANREAGEKIGALTKFFKRPDPNYFTFNSFMAACLEQIFVFDALALIMRPKFGGQFGMGGRGLLGSELESLRLVSGPTIRPLLDLHGGHPAPPNPAFQQFLYGVPRSDYPTIIGGYDIDDSALAGSEYNSFTMDVMRYEPLWTRRETPYGFPPIERALLPIISGLQKQEYQLDYFTEGSVPAVYISPGDANITATQVKELQDALNGIAGDPAFHMKVVVLPPGSKVEPQRPVDLSDGFDQLVMTQVCCVPGTEIITKRGLIPIEDVGIGDEVITHAGRWRPVLAKMKSPAHDVRRIEANGFESLEVTGNHKLRAARYSQTASHRSVYEGTDWVPADQIQPKRIRGDFDAVTLPVITPGNTDATLAVYDHAQILSRANHLTKLLPDSVPMNAAFGRLLGFYMAEGSTGSGQVQWAFHEDEHAYHQMVMDDLRTIFGLESKLKTVPESRGVVIICNSALLARLFACGTAKTKKLPVWAWGGSPEFYESLLWAWIAGDGTWGEGNWSGNTASRDLAWQMRVIAVACGWELGITTWVQSPSVIKGREAKGGGVMYKLRAVRKGARRGTYRIDGSNLTSPVRVNEPSDYAGQWVYNLNVQEDHSYSTTGGTISNCMAFDVQPIELGILPNIGSGGTQDASASAIRLGSQEAREVKSRKSTKPLLHYLTDIFNYVIQDVCHCEDLQFQFEGLADDEDKQAITELGVQQVQNGIASIDEVRDRLDLAPWGLEETSEPVVFTAQGPIPFSMAPQLIMAAQQGQNGGGNGGNNRTQGTNSGQRTSSSRSTSKQPAVRQAGQTKPNGSHKAPLAPHRESLTPAHSAASGVVQSSTPRTGGTTSRSSVAGSRKKAVEAELSSLGRHLRKGRDISTWKPEHITLRTLLNVKSFITDGYLTDVALRKAGELHLSQFDDEDCVVKVDSGSPPMWPGWDHDLRIVGTYKGLVADAFKAADITASQLRQKAATGQMYVSGPTLRGLISDGVHDTFMEVLKPLWAEAYSAGYASGKCLVTGEEPDFTQIKRGPNMQNFVETEGQHWLDQISRTGLKDAQSRIPTIARTEVARAMNAGAVQAYRDNGVAYKHLLVAPDDTCDVCKNAEAEGDIPLDSIFPSGGLGGPFHPNCVIGSTKIAAADVTRVYEREYVGEFIIIRTASGNELTVTPNHPIATKRGWVPATELKVGENVLISTGVKRTPGVIPDVDDIPSTIEEIAQSLPVTLGGMPASSEDFHGDSFDGDVYIIRTNGLLGYDSESLIAETRMKEAFRFGDVPSLKAVSFNAERDSFSVSDTLGSTANNVVSRFAEASAFVRTGISHPRVHGSAAISTWDSSLFDPTRDDVPADSEGFCDTLLRLASDVSLDKIVDIKRDVLSAQVYNLESRHGWYIANGIITHNCRCVPAPSGIEVIPPQASKNVGWDTEHPTLLDQQGPIPFLKGSQEDERTLAWLLLRARGEDGKYRFLLQQRDDGTWGLPGGHAHIGEDPWRAALREASEEMGDLPGLTLIRDFNHIEDGGETRVFLYLCDTSYFRPELNGSTPEETRGTGWFRRKEIDDLKLVAPFREDWFESVKLREHVTKHQIVTENGEQLVASDSGEPLYPAGARWPYPHRSDGAEEPHYGTNYIPEPPTRQPRREYDGGEDPGDFPKRRRRNQGPKSQVEQRGSLPSDTDGGAESGVSDVGGRTGVPPSGEKAAGQPVVGMKPPQAPKPGNPRSVPPVVNDPGDAVERWSDEDQSDVIVPQPEKTAQLTPEQQHDVDLADPAKPGGPSDYSDPNPVDPEHVLNLMRSNFPEKALEWVKRARWIGPVQIPWERIDADDEESWAASHQPEAVSRFARDIKAGTGHTNPSILIQDDDSPKAIIIDGHHRALARKKLGRPVLAYVGQIDPRDRMAAEETHSLQVHHGADIRNKLND